MKFTMIIVVILSGVISIAACYSGSNVQSKTGNALVNQETINKPTENSAIVNQEQVDCNERLVQIRTVSIKEGSARAVDDYKNALKQGCDTTEIRMNLGLALASLKRFAEASEQYRVVLTREPNNWSANWTLAQTLILELGQFDEGLRLVYKARELDDMDDIGYNYDFVIAKAYDGLGDKQQASLHYRIFIKGQSKVWKNDPRLTEAKERLSSLEKR